MTPRTILAALYRLWTGRTVEAERAAEPPPIVRGAVKNVETPSRTECKNGNCEVCQRLKSLPWKSEER